MEEKQNKTQLLKAFLTYQFCNVFYIISHTVPADPFSSHQRIK